MKSMDTSKANFKERIPVYVMANFNKYQLSQSRVKTLAEKIL
jgi:hypothetical protein